MTHRVEQVVEAKAAKAEREALRRLEQLARRQGGK